jgi:sulfate permease, SulP family
VTDLPQRPEVSAWLRWLPPIGWLSEYRATWLPRDIVAGVTLAAYAIPVSLAYATLAGLPPQVGIYGYLLGGWATRFSAHRAKWRSARPQPSH